MAKIPHKIYKEDKLVGPLTLKQFLYILGGASLSFVAYQYYAQGYLFFTEFLVISIMIMLFSLSFAFLQINGRPFITFLGNLLTYILVSKKRLWSKDNSMHNKPIIKKTPRPKQILDTQTEIPKSQLEQLANILDTGGKINTDVDTNEREINTIRQNKVSPIKTESELGLEDVLSDVEI